MRKLAILVEGDQNSGKTSTIRHLVNSHNNNKNIRIMKKGWQRVFLNSIFDYLQLDFYCIPASPSETDITLKNRFYKWARIPNVLVIALQPNGKHYDNSNLFLMNNNYEILRYRIKNSKGSDDWERFDSNTKINKLDNRTNEIINDIRNFILTNEII